MYPNFDVAATAPAYALDAPSLIPPAWLTTETVNFSLWSAPPGWTVAHHLWRTE